MIMHGVIDDRGSNCGVDVLTSNMCVASYKNMIIYAQVK